MIFKIEFMDSVLTFFFANDVTWLSTSNPKASPRVRITYWRLQTFEVFITFVIQNVDSLYDVAFLILMKLHITSRQSCFRAKFAARFLMKVTRWLWDRSFYVISWILLTCCFSLPLLFSPVPFSEVERMICRIHPLDALVHRIL